MKPFAAGCILLLQGCTFYGAEKAADPVERGLLYVASAIIVAAILNIIFRK